MTDHLAAIHAACFTDAPRPWSAAEITALAAAPGGFLIEQPGGFVLGRALAGEAELLTIAVAPEARRQGLGTALLAAFTAAAAARGAETAFLEVAADNAPALALYLGAGWHETGRRRGYYRPRAAPPIDALVLARSLAPAA